MVKYTDGFMFGKSLFYHWSHDKIAFVSIITLKCHDSNLNSLYFYYCGHHYSWWYEYKYNFVTFVGKFLIYVSELRIIHVAVNENADRLNNCLIQV